MLEKFRSKILGINAALFSSLFFFLPMHVAPAYIITIVMLALCIMEGNFTEKWQRLRKSPLFWIFQAYFWIFPLSLLWTEDLDAGIRMVGRYAFFLLSPVYLLVARRTPLHRCVVTFLAGVALAEALAYYNWLQMHIFTDWPAGIRVRKSAEDTAPFVDRIMYAPILAWAGYLALREAITKRRFIRWIYAALAVATFINLIFSGGRTGQLVFLVLLTTLIFQRLTKKPGTAALTSLLIISSLSAAAYFSNNQFRERVDLAAHEVAHYQESINTSIGLRINFYINSIAMFSSNPPAGVGAGDFATEYKKINDIKSPEWDSTPNPHNQYLFTLATTGLLGGALLMLALVPPGIWSKSKLQHPDVARALVIFMATISLFESYLWRSNTSLLYIIFASQLINPTPSRATLNPDNKSPATQ